MSYWKHKHVLVTGCTGMVGSHLAARLVEEGAQVVGLIRDLVPQTFLQSAGFEDRMVVVRGDLIDADVIDRAFNEYEIDTCFHLAAQTIVGVANRSPRSTFDANIRGTWNMLEAARNAPKLRRLIVASSDKAYGAQEQLPYYEDAPLAGRHPYDASKSCADLLAQAYFHTYELPLAVTRCGNIFGPGDLNFNRVIPGSMRSAFYNEDPIIRSDGSPTRDYLYVLDVVEAFLCLAKALDDERFHGEAFNFSYEMPQSVSEIVGRVLQVLGRDDLGPDIQGTGIPPGEIPHQYLSAEKARRDLGWTPRFGIDEGLLATYDWYRAYFETAEKQSAP